MSLEALSDSRNLQGRDADVTRLSNNRSVIGFRGAEDLGDELHAIFQIEGTISPDTGAGSIAARDTRLGLEGKLGTLFGGNWVTPYNGATSSLDPFYPTTAGYMSIMGNGSASTTDNVIDTSSFDRRQQNSLHYWTPGWNGWSARLALGLNEERPANGAKPSLSSAALIYDRGPYYFTVAHERHHEYQGPGTHDDGTKIALAYRFGQTKLAAIAEWLSYETMPGRLERKSYYLSASRQEGPHGLHLGIAKAADTTGSSSKKVGFMQSGPDSGAVHYTVGYDYGFSKRTTLFSYFTHLRNDKNGNYDLAINSVGAGQGATVKGLALGMRHSF
ncbi:porin [Undibacterium terreum]|uniref:Porin n=2 Tax=Undibacterium terreum TaxID=1224302 RepID=A0A916XI28_9BURK|nr:porin [Undibacterium terreum]